jgi:UDP-glucose 4-epimerase
MIKKKRILILGGLGFIGRNLYNSLKREGYAVSILADRFNETSQDLSEEERSEVLVGSILDMEFMEEAVRGFDVIFSMAGSSGAADSIKNPYQDLDTNLKGHLNILEACKKNNPHALLIFPSSRLVYGKPLLNPVDEKHPLHPESIYAIHKLTTEHYYLLYHRLYAMKCIIFRVSNPFGPYQRFGSNNYGVLNWFIHNAIVKRPIEIFGDGGQQRDFIYIDDVVNLLTASIECDTMHGKIYNVGYGKGTSLKETALMIQKLIPSTKILFKPWPEIDQKIETGDYISDLHLLQQDISWSPAISLEEGIQKTIKFYEGSK